MNKSQVTFDEPDGWPKRWILFNLDTPVAKRRQQGDSSMMIWAGINQTITGSFKAKEEIKLNSASYCNFMEDLVQVPVSKWSVYLWMTVPLIMNLG